ncbi:MAG: GlsB/YeaQ/YmgE family stress response membrane protein, partial [Spirochaetes bacterium]|nr:GlsB/YeaQ/YmgE family stress response membrane protein [Spirochaetota bacterium]
QFFMGGGLGWILSIVLGIAGCWFGGWLFGRLGIGSGGLLFRIVAGVVGACLILFVVRLIMN